MKDISIVEKIYPSQPLIFEEAEKNIIKKIKDKRLFYTISTYLILLVIIVIGTFLKGGSGRHKFNAEDWVRFYKVIPWFLAFILALLTGYFIYYYLKVVHPYVKDAKQGLKEIVFFKPEKYKTPFFAEYYLVTPIKNKLRIKINQELYDAVQEDTVAFISLALHSRFVFSIDIGGRKMKFNETNALIDI